MPAKQSKSKPATRRASPARKKGASSAIAAKEFFAQDSARGDHEIALEGQVIPLTSMQRVLFPKDGYTKFDILKYYFTVGKYILPYLKDRPVIMKRYPAGINKKFFYQHNFPNAPDFLRTEVIMAKANGWGTTKESSTPKEVNYVVVQDVADILYLVNLGAISQNPFHTRIDDPLHPDYFVFDLDPGETATYKDVCKLAIAVRDVLESVKLNCYPKTSGSSGIHLHVPIKPVNTYHDVVHFAKAVSRIVAEEHPEVATVTRRVKDREKGQIYMDYLQNLEGKSIASVYCVRARDGAPVSTPLEWSEVKRCVPISKFTIETVPKRLKAKGDMFKKVLTQKQDLAAAQKRLNKLYDLD